MKEPMPQFDTSRPKKYYTLVVEVEDFNEIIFGLETSITDRCDSKNCRQWVMGVIQRLKEQIKSSGN